MAVYENDSTMPVIFLGPRKIWKTYFDSEQPVPSYCHNSIRPEDNETHIETPTSEWNAGLSHGQDGLRFAVLRHAFHRSVFMIKLSKNRQTRAFSVFCFDHAYPRMVCADRRSRANEDYYNLYLGAYKQRTLKLIRTNPARSDQALDHRPLRHAEENPI